MPIHEQRQGKSFLYLITEDIQQRAQAIRLEARSARQRSQAMRQMCQLARHMRKTAQVERALWRDHIYRVRDMAKLRPSLTASDELTFNAQYQISLNSFSD